MAKDWTNSWLKKCWSPHDGVYYVERKFGKKPGTKGTTKPNWDSIKYKAIDLKLKNKIKKRKDWFWVKIRLGKRP